MWKQCEYLSTPPLYLRPPGPQYTNQLRDVGRKMREIYHWITISNHLLQLFQESIINDQLRFQIVQFRHTQCRRLTDVWILIAETLLQWVAEIVDYLLRTQTPHCANSQRSNEGVRIISIFNEGVDREDDKLRLCFGIVHKI